MSFGQPISIDMVGLGTQPSSNQTQLDSPVYGPWKYNGNLYIVLTPYFPNSGPGLTIADVWKSTDSGATWNVVDHAHAPSIRTMFASFDDLQTISLAYTLYFDGATPVPLKIIPFDLATETWGVVSVDGPLSGVLGIAITLSQSFSRPDGSLLLNYMRDPDGELYCVSYSAGAWGAPFALDTNTLPIIGALGILNVGTFGSMDSTGRVHYFFSLTGPVSVFYFYQSVTIGNVLESFADLTAYNIAFRLGQPCIVNGNTLIFPFNTFDPGNPLCILVGSPLNAVTFTLHTGIDTTLTQTVHVVSFPSAVFVNEKLQIVYSTSNASAVSGGRLRIVYTSDFATYVFAAQDIFDISQPGVPADFLVNFNGMWEFNLSGDGVAISAFEPGGVSNTGITWFLAGALTSIPTTPIIIDAQHLAVTILPNPTKDC